MPTRIEWYWSRFPWFAEELAEHLLSSCNVHALRNRELPQAWLDLRVRFIENNDLVSSCWQSHFSLCESLDFVSYDVDSSIYANQDMSVNSRVASGNVIHTFRHLRSIPKHPPCKRHLGERVRDNVLMLFCRYRVSPAGITQQV
jgi:hypothetical protein